jgi:hypothetical protein
VALRSQEVCNPQAWEWLAYLEDGMNKGIRTLSDIRDRCYVVDGHWIFKGAISSGQTRVHAPDYSRGGGMKTQTGPRAVWHLKTGQPIPKGMRVFHNCQEPHCLNPEHLACRTEQEHGEYLRSTGKHKGLLSKIIANRKINARRTTVTPEALELILYSDLKGTEIHALTGVCRQTISRIRTGQSQIGAGVFNGLSGLGGRA